MTSISSIISVLWTVFLFFSANFVALVEAEVELCSCSPTVFNFILDFSNGCTVNDIKGNPGVVESLCFQEEVPAVPGQPPANSFVEKVEPLTEEEERCYAIMDSTAINDRIEQDGYVEFLNLLAHGYLEDNGINTFDELSWALKYAWATLTSQCTAMGVCQADRANLFVAGVDGEPVSEAQVDFLNDICKTAIDTLGQEGMVNFDFDPMQQALQDDPVVEVVNAQFLEFDTKGDLTVINQDNTYNSTTLKDGAAMQFYSVSSKLDTSVPLADQMERPALVPGGASLILYGKTASGKVVRNRFFWLYNMECGRETNPVQVGDQIGWVKVEPDLGGAWPAFCAALPPDSPTISPRTNEPTLTPSASPITSPPPPPTTISPTLMATSMSYESSLSISTGDNTKAGKGKASKKAKTKGASLSMSL